MTAVAMVQLRTIWLDDYFPTLQERFGERPFMVTEGRDGHPVNVTSFAPSVLTLPAVLVFDLAGASGWETWMEAGMLTAALTAALSVLVLFLLITRLTTRRRVFLVASAYAFGTLTWGVAGQALWQHAPAMLALSLALLALHDRRFALAGASLAAMVASRPSTPIIALFLLPLVGQAVRDWTRFAVGALPIGLALLGYNLYVFGVPLRTGYAIEGESTASLFEGRLLEGLSGLVISPGRGLPCIRPFSSSRSSARSRVSGRRSTAGLRSPLSPTSSRWDGTPSGGVENRSGRACSRTRCPCSRSCSCPHSRPLCAGNGCGGRSA